MIYRKRVVALEEGEFGVVMVRISPDLVHEAHDAIAALEKQGESAFQRWIQLVFAKTVADYLHRNDVDAQLAAQAAPEVCTKRLDDLWVMDELLVRVRASGVSGQGRVGLRDILERHRLIGPSVNERGELNEPLADYYVQTIFLMSLEELRQAFEMEIGMLPAVIAGGLAHPQVVASGRVERWGRRYYITVPLTQTCDAISLPAYLRLLVNELRNLP